MCEFLDYYMVYEVFSKSMNLFSKYFNKYIFVTKHGQEICSKWMKNAKYNVMNPNENIDNIILCMKFCPYP